MARRKSKSNHVSPARQAATKQLNAEYRAKAAKLKEAGVLSAKVNARKNITRSTRTKINKFNDVLLGNSVVVKMPKVNKPKNLAEMVAKYVDAGIALKRGGVVTVPKTAENMRAKIRAGKEPVIETISPIKEFRYENVQTERPRKLGETHIVLLPFKASSMQRIVEELSNDPTRYDDMKPATAQFSFRVFGWLRGNGSGDTNVGFVDVAELVQEVTINYKHLFAKGNTRQAAANFQIIWFTGTYPKESKLSEKIHNEMKPRKSKRMSAKGRAAYYEKAEKRDKAAYRAQLSRANQSEEQAAARRAKQLAYYHATKDKRK